jgi:hypothetical protein
MGLRQQPAYPVYGDTDCTNFVSQTMRAGGWATVGGSAWDILVNRGDNSKWWYGYSPSQCSYSWGAAQNWHLFANTYSGRTYILSSVYAGHRRRGPSASGRRAAGRKPARLEHARALAALGEHTDDGRALLKQTYDLADRCGAHGLRSALASRLDLNQ